jgi:cobalt-zinc-cadmium efflux system protein
VVLIAGAVFVLAGALPRLFNPVMPDTGGMLLIAVLGVAFNGMAVLRARRGKSLNEQVVTWHLLEDVIGWIAVLVGALLMRWFDLPLLDPLLSIGISLFILWNVARKLHEVLRLFLQGTPAGVTTAQVAALLTAPPDVTDAHDIHCWSMDGAYHVLSAHLVVGDGVTPDRAHAIKTEVRAALHDLGIEHATLEIERGGEECEGGC